jgi:putative oxidoreductase
MSNQNDVVALVGRIFIAVLFVLSGFGKLAAPGSTQAYIAAFGLPAPVLAYIVSTAVELIGGGLLIAGFRVRIVAVVLAAFSLVAAVFFHRNFADQNQMIHFVKDIAIAGGLLQVAAFGSGRFALDRRFGRTDAPTGADSLAAS